jgi:hypothetical protein
MAEFAARARQHSLEPEAGPQPQVGHIIPNVTPMNAPKVCGRRAGHLSHLGSIWAPDGGPAVVPVHRRVSSKAKPAAGPDTEIEVLSQRISGQVLVKLELA